MAGPPVITYGATTRLLNMSTNMKVGRAKEKPFLLMVNPSSPIVLSEIFLICDEQIDTGLLGGVLKARKSNGFPGMATNYATQGMEKLPSPSENSSLWFYARCCGKAGFPLCYAKSVRGIHHARRSTA